MLIGQVQHRARLTSRGGAEVAVRATLQTLEERISEGAYQNLIAQLPQGIGDYQDSSDTDRRRPGERFSLDEFIDRVARREGVRKQDAAFCQDDAGHGKQRIERPDCELDADDQDGGEVLDHSLPSASGLSGAAGFDNSSKPAES